MISRKFVSVVASAALLTFCLGACASKKSDSKSGSSSAAVKGKKGSTASGPAASKSAGQKNGSTITENQSKAADKGEDFEGVACDAELEATAWCGDEHTAIFCHEGHWYGLDCAQIGGDVCAETTDAHTVDCDAPDEVE